MSTLFKEAVDTKVVGLDNELTPLEKLEYDNIDNVIKEIENIKKKHLYPFYIEILPIELISGILVGKNFRNQRYWLCEIQKVWKKDNELYVQVKSHKKNDPWTMKFKTLYTDCKEFNISRNIKDKYFKRINVMNADDQINYLKGKKKKYDELYNKTVKSANTLIKDELSKHNNEIVVTRQAIRQSIRSIQQDTKVIADAWNSTLSEKEQQTLINWLSKNIYSMRLYVVKGSRWDKAISELYPDATYGTPRRTIPSDKSKDSINGYLSVNTIEGNVPYDILKKVTHKQNSEDVIKYYGKNKYRINNYLLVLYLLNNYNKNGFKLGKTNLNKDITL